METSCANRGSSNWTVTLAPHDVAALLMVDAGPESEDLVDGSLEPPCAWPFLALQCAAGNGSYIYNGTLVKWGF